MKTATQLGLFLNKPKFKEIEQILPEIVTFYKGGYNPVRYEILSEDRHK